ncbi:MAG: FAD-dependent oxidoreductase [Chloroflexi bacterium]|nr:FAD-dependent oxidoreductase [Chloroflexota bacterium]
MTETFTKLFQPLKIGPHTLKNRIIKSPITTRLSLTSGEVSPQLLQHYASEAKGGAAMITIESSEIEDRHPRIRPNVRINSDAYLAGLHELAEAIHLNGALACIQLRHVGMWGVDPISPSGIACRKSGGRGFVESRQITVEEIAEVIRLFAEAAYRAKFAEFDMVEIHGGTSYLLQQFVSPHTNRRQDGWGSTFENRIRLPLEIVRQIKQKCGPEFPVGYRVVLDERMAGGVTFDESRVFVKRLAEAGIAYVSPMLGNYETFHTGEGTQAMRSPRAATVKYTEPLKKEVNIPVFATFQVHEPELMEEILEKGKADAIVLGRPLLADPELPEKLRTGRIEDISRCILCNACNDTTAVTQQKICCTQNPATGREVYSSVVWALYPKTVVVVGGGPAGLEAARVAALRGHRVTLLEKENELGGQIRVAALPIGKDHFMPYVIGWRARECRKAGVKIELGVEATPQLVGKYNPDAVIIATGATPCVPGIPGVHGKNVVCAAYVLRQEVKVGKRVVVAGGGMVGAETADFLAEKGLAESVTIIEMLPEIAAGMGLWNLAYITQKLAEFKVDVLTETTVREITAAGVLVAGKDGKKQSIAADTVVLALGAVSNDGLSAALAGKVRAVYSVGDCKKPRNLTEAILEGNFVGRQI